MKKYIICLVILSILVTFNFSYGVVLKKELGETLIAISFGDKTDEVGFIKEEIIRKDGVEISTLPNSFLIYKEEFFILDQYNSRIMCLKNGKIQKNISYKKFLNGGDDQAEDFAIISDNEFAITLSGSNDILLIPSGKRIKTIAKALYTINLIDGKLCFKDAMDDRLGNVETLDNSKTIKNNEVYMMEEKDELYVEKSDNGLRKVVLTDNSWFPLPKSLMEKKEKMCARIIIPVGEDEDENIFLKVLFGKSNDKIISAYIYKFMRSGKLIGRVEVPKSPSMSSNRTIRVSKNGIIYYSKKEDGKYKIKKYIVN